MSNTPPDRSKSLTRLSPALIGGGVLVIALGFGLFAVGLFLNGSSTYQSDYDNFFWPQILRGVAIMLCILPTTRLAGLGPAAERADLSLPWN